MSEIQYSVVFNENSIEIFDDTCCSISNCYMVAFSVKEKIGRLAVKENIALNFDKTKLMILITGYNIGQGSNYKIINNIVFDQGFIKDKQITFTFSSVSDWSTIKGF